MKKYFFIAFVFSTLLSFAQKTVTADNVSVKKKLTIAGKVVTASKINNPDTLAGQAASYYASAASVTSVELQVSGKASPAQVAQQIRDSNNVNQRFLSKLHFRGGASATDSIYVNGLIDSTKTKDTLLAHNNRLRTLEEASTGSALWSPSSTDITNTNSGKIITNNNGIQFGNGFAPYRIYYYINGSSQTFMVMSNPSHFAIHNEGPILGADRGLYWSGNTTDYNVTTNLAQRDLVIGRLRAGVLGVGGGGGTIGIGRVEYATTAEPADPASGKAVTWFDGTNLKIKKNVGGTVTSTTLF